MKSFYISIALFTILIISTIVNSLFITSRTSQLLLLSDEIPSIESEECLSRMKALKENWEQFKKTAFLTVSYNELNRISGLIEELHIHYHNNNMVDFEHTKGLIKIALQELSRFERLKVENVL